MDTLSQIFAQLDDWRHLPDYQLERRADIFFAVYLPRFLSMRLQTPFSDLLVPEFPLRLGTLFPEQQGNNPNASCKVDYLALAADLSRAAFIELKTDVSSRRNEQDDYLVAAQRVGLHNLLDGLRNIVAASQHKHKYCCLLKLLKRHKLLELPASLDAALASKRYASAVNACVKDILVTAPPVPIEVFYVQPVAKTSDEIGFSEIAGWLEETPDPLAVRFAASLRRWAADKAGWPVLNG